MPKWLKVFPVAVKEWRRESKELNHMGVMTTADCGALATRAYIASQIQQLAVEIEKEGRIVEGENGEKSSPKCVQLTALLGEYRLLGRALGLDPSSRAGMKVERPKPMGKVESFMGRKNVGGEGPR